MAITDEKIEQSIIQYRQSKSFIRFCEENPYDHHIYYRFMAWWQLERVKESLDAGGQITYALLTRAAGFGGWSTTQIASREEANIYKNAGFLYYWDQYDAPTPDKGPAGITKILVDVKASSLERQCLLLPHYWLYPSSADVPQGSEPCDIPSWLDTLLQEGWQPHTHTTSEWFDDLFGCSDSKTLDSRFDNKKIWKSLGNLSFSAAYKKVGKSLAFNPLIAAIREEIKKSQFTFTPNEYDPGKVDSSEGDLKKQEANRIIQASFYKLENKPSTNILNSLARFFVEFDPVSADVEKRFKYINTMQIFYKTLFSLRSDSLTGNFPDISGQEDLFCSTFEDWVADGLIKMPSYDEDFPFSIMFQSIVSSQGISELVVFEDALRSFNLKSYAAYSPNDTTSQALHERCRLVADWLKQVYVEGEEEQYMLGNPSQILGEAAIPEKIIDSNMLRVIKLQQEAQEIISALISRHDLLSGQVVRSCKDVEKVECDMHSRSVQISFKTGEGNSIWADNLSDEEARILYKISNLWSDFCQDDLPLVFSLNPIPYSQYSPFNMGVSDVKTRMANISMAIDFLIGKGLIPATNKLAIMLQLYRDGII